MESPTPFSIRLRAATRAALEEHSRRRGEPKSRLAERLIEEGLRMQAHPGIVFRDGPAGRRPALAAGPDVWEVVETLLGTGLAGEEAITATAEWGALAPSQVRAALSYYAEHREEVDDWIEANRREAERAREAWEREQRALGAA